MSFAKSVSNYCNRTKKALRENVIGINEYAVKGIVKKNPVLTGRSKGNWQASLDIPISTQSLLNYDKSGNSTISKARKYINNSFGKVFYFSNNVIYIRFLEHGSSIKAPFGMVGITVEEVKILIRKYHATR